MEFEELYEQYSQTIYQYIYMLVGETRQAEDLTQETFTKAWRSLDRYEGKSTYKTWLTAIARYTVFDHLRKKTPFTWQSILKPDDIVATYTPESWLLQNEEQFELYEAIGALKFEYREAIVLTKIEGYTANQAADILGWKAKKVHNAVERGMKQLKLALQGGGFDGQ